jgi:glucose 1-dehydrogenase
MEPLKGKVAVITGGSRGLGLAIAEAFVQQGACVVIASRSQASVQQAVAALQARGARVQGTSCDVGEREQVEHLAQFAIDQFGGFDVWINNAGVSAPYGPTVAQDPEVFVRTVKTNILGVYYGSVAAMRHFLPRRQGKLINILGRGDREPVPLQNAYASSKAWMRSFTLALAKEYEQSGVGVFCYNPGLMDTDMMQEVEAVAGYEARVAPLQTVMRMWANPPEVPARRVAWLASAATDGRTGLYVRELGPLQILRGVVREGLRVLARRPVPARELHVSSVPPYDP